MAATMMTALAIVGLIDRAARKPRWLLSWDALLLVMIYTGTMVIIYQNAAS